MVDVYLNHEFPISILCPLPFITTSPFPDLLSKLRFFCSLEISATISIYVVFLSAHAATSSSKVETVATFDLKADGSIICCGLLT